MLVITRQVDDSIRIGDDILITICQITPKNVRIAIQAPDSTNIVRTEIDRTDLSAKLLSERDDNAE